MGNKQSSKGGTPASHKIKVCKARQYLSRCIPKAVRTQQVNALMQGFKLKNLVMLGVLTPVQAKTIRGMLKVQQNPKPAPVKMVTNTPQNPKQKVIVTTQQKQWLVGAASYSTTPVSFTGFVTGCVNGVYTVFIPKRGSTPPCTVHASAGGTGLQQAYIITQWL